MPLSHDVRIERLSRYLFNAPSWPVSLACILILGLMVDGAGLLVTGRMTYFGMLCVAVPAVIAFLCTKPYINLSGRQMTWNRSALLALAMAVFCTIITAIASLVSIHFLPLGFAISLGLITGLRIMVLGAISDYRIPRMLPPALFQAVPALVAAVFILPAGFWKPALAILVIFILMFVLFLWMIERPVKRAFNIRLLSFVNAYMAHLTDGSRIMEEFFRQIGEEIYVPQSSLFFKKDNGDPVMLTVPNVHPGPMGDIGGGNLPSVLQDAFPGIVMVPHGCATHDQNLVSETEIDKIVEAIQKASSHLSYSSLVSHSVRIQEGSVSLLFQRFGGAFLLVSTRSPKKTEDLDFNIGLTIMAEGHGVSPDILFIDAHNCSTHDMTPVHPATATAREYTRACKRAYERFSSLEMLPMGIGAASVPVPYTREQGFGQEGIKVLVVKAGDQVTVYILFDGNNLREGAREEIRNHFLGRFDEVEIMTTDSHVVNTESGNNPVGLHMTATELIPLVESGIRNALSSAGPAEVAGSTAECERVVVFGSQRISQLASTVNAMLALIVPVSVIMLLLALILSWIVYRFFT